MNQPIEAQTGEELLALIPEPTSSNSERIEFIDKTQRFIDEYTGQPGRFFWGVEVTETGHHPELGFAPATAE